MRRPEENLERIADALKSLAFDFGILTIVAVAFFVKSC